MKTKQSSSQNHSPSIISILSKDLDGQARIALFVIAGLLIIGAIFIASMNTGKQSTGSIVQTQNNPDVLIDQPGPNDTIDPSTLENSKGEFKKGEIIVKFNEDQKDKVANFQEDNPNQTGIASIDELNKEYGATKIEKIIDETNAENTTFQDIEETTQEDLGQKDLRTIVKIDVPLHTNIQEVAKEFDADPSVEYAEPNFKIETTRIPNDPYYSSSGSWGQVYDDLYGLKKLNSAAAWDITTGSESVVVAVIDTGFDYNHFDLAENVWTNGDEIPGNNIDDDQNGYIDDIHGYDFYNNDGDPIDDHGHGTHVSGTIAGVGNNNVGVAGVAWNAKIMGVKFLSGGGSGYISAAVNSTYYAVDNGAKVLSNSWGGWGASQSLQDAINYARTHGAVFVAAAGNSNADATNYQPAGLDNVLTVAATDYNDNRASFSNYGQKVEVAAPGVSTLSLRGAGTTMGSVVGSYYTTASGTSMATPHVAGIAALLFAQNSNFTPEEVEQKIINGVDTITPDQYIGAGRVNSYGALTYDATQPSILLGDITIDDSAGNNNGTINPGETINIITQIRNTMYEATSVTGVLSTTDPYVTFPDANSNFGDMPNASTRDNTADPFRIHVSSSIPKGRDITFSIFILANSGAYTKTLTFEKTVGQQKVSGIISENTTWTGNGSEYLITGDVTVNNGVTLVIEAGAHVLFDGYYGMTINGNVQVQGTAHDRVLFTTTEGTPSAYWGDWKQILFANGSTGSINYAQIEHAVIGTKIEYSNATVSNTLYRYNRFGLILGAENSAVVNDNMIARNTYGVVIANYQLYGYWGYLSKSTNNNPSLEQNLITNNLYKGFIIWIDTSSNPTITHNDIFPHSYYQYGWVGIYQTFARYAIDEGNHTINASDNYWGTTDAQTIEFHIYDKQDDSSCGDVITSSPSQQPFSNSTDSDGDGITDQKEYAYELNPFNRADGNADSDGDSISNLHETENNTNPQVADTDFDQTPDNIENTYAFLALYPNSPAVNYLYSEVYSENHAPQAGQRIRARITLRNRSYEVVPNETITISSNRSSDKIEQPQLPTNRNGNAYAYITPSQNGISQISAIVTSENNLPLHDTTLLRVQKAPDQQPDPEPEPTPEPPTEEPQPPTPEPVPPDEPRDPGAELFVTAPHSDNQSLIRKFDRNGTKISPEYNGFPPEFNIGARIATGDVDGDGEEEIVVGAGPGGGPMIRVFEKDGSLKPIQFFAFHPNNRDGVDVATGDVDGDGQKEIAVTQYQNQEAWVKVYRYDDRQTIIGEWLAFPRGAEIGASVAMGDVDYDGKAEVLVGAGTGGGPMIRVFEADGTRKPIQFFAFHPRGRTGVDVATGDIDGDGKAEVIVSQRKEESWVKVYRYNDQHSVVGSWRAYPSGVESGANISSLDVDGNGKDEIIVGPGPGFRPHVRTYSPSGRILAPNFYAYDTRYEGGVDVAGFSN